LARSARMSAPELPFQRWRHFKEAFTPELIARAIEESDIPVKHCLDPFAGSGTTALACQFLGVHPVAIEVNPFLADLTEAKLAAYDPDTLARDFGTVLRIAAAKPIDPDKAFAHLPATFIEPGVRNRWLFDRAAAGRFASLLGGIELLSDDKHRRLFRVLLGGVLVDASNAVVNGKGRRYRRGWDRRPRDPRLVDALFCRSVQRAISEIHRCARRTCTTYEIKRGDCRSILQEQVTCELSVFSPPYPNSFDYTDVYNIELWMLGLERPPFRPDRWHSMRA
jgi:DNA methylase